MTKSFPEDLWTILTRKIYDTSKYLEKLPSVISVNSFGQVLHLVTPKRVHTIDSIRQFLIQSGEAEITIETAEATIEDVFIFLMNNPKEKS